MSSGVLLSREVDAGTRQSSEAEGVHWRGTGPRPTRAPRNEREARKFDEADKHKVYIKGRRTETGRLVYDVFRILGPGRLEFYARDCIWYEEALALSMDAMLGRVSISLAPAQRTVLHGDKMASPNRQWWMPGGTTLDVRPTSDPTLTVVRPKFARPGHLETR